MGTDLGEKQLVLKLSSHIIVPMKQLGVESVWDIRPSVCSVKTSVAINKRLSECHKTQTDHTLAHHMCQLTKSIKSGYKQFIAILQ